jgi:hypothetical protein
MAVTIWEFVIITTRYPGWWLAGVFDIAILVLISGFILVGEWSKRKKEDH